MKRVIIAIVASFTLLSSSAQVLRTAYFMEGSYLRTDMNPALIPDRGYFTLPLLGGVGVGLNNNFLSVDNFVYNRDGATVTALDSRVEAAEFLGKLPKSDKLGTNVDLNLLSVGFATKKIFWNFGVKAHVTADILTSKDLYSALKSLGNNAYDLTNIGFETTSYGEVYLGACYQVNDWIRAGARLKGLVGALNIAGSVTSGKFSITQSEVAADLRGTMRGSGLLFDGSKKVTDTKDFESVIADPIQVGNINNGGFAVDLGAEVRLLNEQLRLSASVTDLGFIKWKQGGAAAMDFGYNFKFRGVNITTGEADMESDAKIELAEPKGYTRRLNTTINVGAEYNILNNWIAFGLLSHTEFRSLYTISELTASVNFRIGKHFTTTLSHTLCNRNRFGIFGFAMNVHTAGLNLFLGTDFIDTHYVATESISIPRYQKSLNMYFGLGFNLGKNKK